MVDPGLMARINRMEQALKRLEYYTSLSLDEIREQDLIPALEREVHVVIEALLDIGNNLISSMGWGVPTSYREIAFILMRNNVLDRELGAKLASLAGLRNILVHLYSMVDYDLLYSHARDLVRDARHILDKIIRYMVEHGIDP